MAATMSLCLMLSALPLASASDVCTGLQCEQFEETEDSHMLQLKSADTRAKGGMCEKKTGGSCKFFGCSASRNSQCVDGECVCSAGHCARGGVCLTGVGFVQEVASNESTVCEKETGGSCQFLGCDGYRNAECVAGLCVCASGLCSKDGVCVTKPTTETTTVEPTTETTTEEPKQAPAVTCQFRDNVQCPGSDASCRGNQCCPGTDESDGKTFPCPSASPSYDGCASHTKVQDCLGAFYQEVASNESAVCEKETGGSCQFLGCDGYRNAECVAGLCVCASGLCAKDGVCVTKPTTETTTVEPTTETTTEEPKQAPAVTCQFRDNVQCPGSDASCRGNQCCPGTDESDGKTFPCPSASPSYDGCASHTKVQDCLGA